MTKTITLELTPYVYVDFEGFLRDRSGKVLRNIPCVQGEAEAAEVIIASGCKRVSVRLVIDLE
jgi:hypothetical protein